MKRLILITALIFALLVPTSASASFLGSGLAERAMRAALLRHPNLSFGAAYARRVKCNMRLDDERVKCKMSWIVGDLAFGGHGTIWITHSDGRNYWNYSYRIVRFNEYCAAVIEADDCTKTYVVR